MNLGFGSFKIYAFVFVLFFWFRLLKFQNQYLKVLGKLRICNMRKREREGEERHIEELGGLRITKTKRVQYRAYTKHNILKFKAGIANLNMETINME